MLVDHQAPVQAPGEITEPLINGSTPANIEQRRALTFSKNKRSSQSL